ncbi:MAG TPA: SprT family zinc-dependent metalloprotease [Gammaproteobacteria bacterium]
MGEQLRLFDEHRVRPSRAHDAPLAVRTSRRARRLILRLVPPHTLELVVPRGTRPNEIAAFVAEHRDWIARARAEIANRYSSERELLPERIELLAIGRSWRVQYRTMPGARPRRIDDGDSLTIVTPDEERQSAPALFRSWLLDQGTLYLKPWLLREARLMSRAPTDVRVRLQRTRWGSCSARGGISLNAALLFLAPEVVRYLLVHELAHLKHMNHSKRFWAHVARFEPDYERLDRTLGNAWDEVPLWAHGRD